MKMDKNEGARSFHYPQLAKYFVSRMSGGVGTSSPYARVEENDRDKLDGEFDDAALVCGYLFRFGQYDKGLWIGVESYGSEGLIDIERMKNLGSLGTSHSKKSQISDFIKHGSLRNRGDISVIYYKTPIDDPDIISNGIVEGLRKVVSPLYQKLLNNKQK